MSSDVHEDLLKRFGPEENPVYEARRRRILEAMLNNTPDVRQQIVQEGRLTEARAMVRRVLARRGLALAPEDEARIDACEDATTLERWLDQAVTAMTVAEALR
jgi:ClpP class serine protease